MAANCLLVGRLWLRSTPDLVSFCGVLLLCLILCWSVRYLTKSKKKQVASSSSSSAYWDEAVARWSRVCELGMQAALREADCSEERIVHILGQIRSEDNFDLGSLKNYQAPLRAAILATLGRGNTPVKRLRSSYRNSVLHWSENERAALCVNLSSNVNIVELKLDYLQVFGTVKGCTLLGHALALNSSVTDLILFMNGIRSDGVRCLLDGLQSNKNLEALHLDNNPLSDEGVRSVAEFLSNNTTLKVLHLGATGMLSEGATHMSSALGTNIALKTLGFGVDSVGTDGVWRLLQPLSADVGNDRDLSNDPKNTTLEGLHLAGAKDEHVDAIRHLIRTNKSLRTLGLHYSRFSSRDWKEIFPALKDNGTLTELSVVDFREPLGENQRCAKHSDFVPLLDVIQNSSTGLEKVTLESEDLISIQVQINEELKINNAYRSQLRGEPQMETTSGRIVLCGYAFAGKTEIAKSMRRIEEGTSLAHSFKIVGKKLVRRFGKDGYKELGARTRGFQVVTLHKQEYVKSVWDFAGQKEYYALHDYLFPDMNNSYFLYVCGCRFPPERSNPEGEVKDEKSIQGECEYWMRFLASNSKSGVTDGRQLPRVKFVLTKTDTVNPPGQIISIAKNVVRTLKVVFQGVLNLSEVVEVVDARSSADVMRLLTASSNNLKEILADKKEYHVCKQVRDLLERWSTGNPLQPVLRLDDFYSLCKEQFKYYKDLEDKLMVVLAYLNNLGEIIFPRHCDFIVTNPSWFGIDVLGSLINAFKEEDLPSYCLHHEQGFVNREDMKKHLEHSLRNMDLKQSIPAEKLMDLMIHLELCFEAEPQQAGSSLFVPALFDDNNETAAKGQRQVEWRLSPTRGLKYFGRRLECDDKRTTFLTPGFFPRLQVHLRNYIHEQEWTKNRGFAVGRNLICFAANGVEVCVEYAGDNDDYIDILVRSWKPYAVALEFIDKHVVRIIRGFCASPQGCQGVFLVESVIRPVCVEELHLCVNRKEHSVLVSELESQLAQDSSYSHTWKEGIPYAGDGDLAIYLLRGEVSQRRMGRRESPNFVVRRPRIIDELPKLFYPTIKDVGTLRQIGTRFNLTKVIPIKLHILCDHPHGPPHKVEGQPGRTITLKARGKGYDVPIAKHSIRVLSAGVGAACRMVGVPVPVLQASSWVDGWFNVPQLSLDGETLHQIMSNGRTLRPVSEEEILEALKRYWDVNPNTQGLMEILRLENGRSFLRDFQLHKVVYKEADHDEMVAWVCTRHFQKGLQEGILESVPH